jgi:hypothetical protein
MSCPMTQSLGAYLLGALDSEEHAQIGTHLGSCGHCRAVADELGPVPALLSQVHVDDLEPPRPPAHLLDRLLASRLESRRWRRLVAVAGTAAVIAGLAASAVVATSDSDTTPPPAETLALTAQDTSSRVSATAWLTDREWGTEVRLRLGGVPAGQWCSLIVRDRDGRTETAASWIVQYGEDVDVPGATAAALDRIRDLEVVTGDGTRLVTIPLAHS